MKDPIPCIVRIAGLSGFVIVLGLSARAIDSRYASDLTMSQHVSVSASNAAQGYRPVSLDANGPTNSPNIVAVWINGRFTNWTTVVGVTRADHSGQPASRPPPTHFLSLSL